MKKFSDYIVVVQEMQKVGQLDPKDKGTIVNIFNSFKEAEELGLNVEKYKTTFNSLVERKNNQIQSFLQSFLQSFQIKSSDDSPEEMQRKWENFDTVLDKLPFGVIKGEKNQNAVHGVQNELDEEIVGLDNNLKDVISVKKARY